MRILVLGVGNILLTDEAIGVRIVEALEQRYILPDYVEILDGGTAGMELLGDMANRDHLIIADAIVYQQNLSASAWPGRRIVGPALHRRVSEKADPGRRDPGITGAAHRFDADGRSDD